VHELPLIKSEGIGTEDCGEQRKQVMGIDHKTTKASENTSIQTNCEKKLRKYSSKMNLQERDINCCKFPLPSLQCCIKYPTSSKYGTYETLYST
jgi:hypothetical protein